ncbi:hypothetical protein L3X38_005145 [Prunus dulcis]|uniref:GDSL-like Lipase/Acylhydrolase superfamily protein n=1 Tax=Prunus dulcis TaxID=3755 RepID=A0AAD4ZQE0_PRUDU|nr:hypothetical protein L3X38_005145 [Prunus dulcis]
MDLELEHLSVDRLETEEERKLKEEIDHLKKELEKESPDKTNSETGQESGGDQASLRDIVLQKERELETLIHDLDDKVRFGQKAIDRPGSGAGRPGSGAGRPGSGAGRAGKEDFWGTETWAGQGQEKDAIFNFGDSNSDTGGLSAVFGQARSPHGESYFHGPAGRYCDGRLVIDFIAKSFGLPFLSAYLDSVGSNFSHGANFATAGSTIRPQNTTLRQSGFSPISLDVQYNEFYDFHPRSQVARNRGGVFKQLMPKAQDFSRALYTFDIGQNDLTAGLFLNMSTTQVKAYVPDVLNQFKNIVKNIYGQGANPKSMDLRNQ